MYDAYIHASVHDGIRTSRARGVQYSFAHNSMDSFRKLLLELRSDLPGLCSGHNSLFVAVESLYSMDGTFAPLEEIVRLWRKSSPEEMGILWSTKHIPPESMVRKDAEWSPYLAWRKEFLRHSH